jgi:hypothetical protein
MIGIAQAMNQMKTRLESVASLAEVAGAEIESYKGKPIGVYFTTEQLQEFVQSIKNKPEINLPYSLVVRNAGNSYDPYSNWNVGYDEGWNACILEVKRLNNLR